MRIITQHFPTHALVAAAGGLTLTLSATVAYAGLVNPYQPAYKVSRADPYTDGAKVDRIDPYTDGARMGHASPYTDGTYSGRQP